MQPVRLLNPAPRKGKKTMATSRRRNASGRFVKRASAARKHNPRRRASRRRNPLPMMAANPRRRSYRRRSNPVVHYRRRRRNPIGSDFSATAMSMLKEAGLGAVGSTLVNALMSYVKSSLPATAQTGMTYSAVKALVTIGLGMMSKHGKAILPMATGALTCQLSQLLISELGTSLPTDGALAGMGYTSPAYQVRGGAGSQMLPQLARAGRANMGKFNGPGQLNKFNGPGQLSQFGPSMNLRQQRNWVQ